MRAAIVSAVRFPGVAGWLLIAFNVWAAQSAWHEYNASMDYCVRFEGRRTLDCLDAGNWFALNMAGVAWLCANVALGAFVIAEQLAYRKRRVEAGRARPVTLRRAALAAVAVVLCLLALAGIGAVLARDVVLWVGHLVVLFGLLLPYTLPLFSFVGAAAFLAYLGVSRLARRLEHRRV